MNWDSLSETIIYNHEKTRRFVRRGAFNAYKY